MPNNKTCKEKEIEIINSLSEPDNLDIKPKIKTKSKTKTKTIQKPKIQPQINLQPVKPEIKEVEFAPIIYISKTTYKLNQIGIRRKIQQIGKYKTKILNTEVIEIKVIKNLFEKTKLKLDKLWTQYKDYWNKRFNKPYEIIEDEKPLIEIYESDK